MGCGCGCNGSTKGCGTMGDVYGDCDSFQVVLSADTVHAIRARLQGEFDSTDIAVRACGALSSEERAAWDVKLASWYDSLDVEPNFWNANTLFRAACAMGKDLEGWRAYMRQKCTVPGPDKIVDAQHDTASMVKWVAGAAVVLGLAYVAGPFVRALAPRR